MAEFGTLHIHFSDCEIDVAAFELRRGGEPCAVEPQVFELLLYLARNPDRLVTKSDLIENVWGGRIVSDSTLASRIKSARRAIGDDGEQQKFIRTVHGRGVRFVGEIRLEPSLAAELFAANDETAAVAAKSRPTIAVLPFANVSGEADQDYFADGLTQDIITDLGRFRLVDVVARSRSFGFRRQGADVKQIGRELGAGYIVTGSLQRRGSRMKLAAELFDAASGHQLWAERFDRRAEDIFAVADDLVRTIAATLAGRVQAIGSAQAKRKPPANLAAYECVLRAQAASMRIGDPAAEAEMRRFYEQAVSLDPTYGRAHAGMAMTLMRDWFRAPTASDEILELAFEHAQKAVMLDRNDSECQETLGWILLHRRSFDAAEESYRRALELNPNSPDELSAMGAVCNFLGRPEEGINWLQRAKQRDPHFDPTWYWHLLGATFFNARRYDDAIASFSQSPSLPAWTQAYLAASHAHGGQIEQAQQLSAALAGAPDFSAAALVAKEPYRQPADREHLHAGLRKAGLLPADAAVPAAARPAIAVLPFANISGDPEQDYFADGLSEDIIADLGKISALYVTPRNSAFAYKGQTVDIQRAAKDLDVCYILDGSVRRMGDQLRIATQLVDGRTGLHVWAERYDRRWEDIFSLRDEIAHGIVAALQLQLLPQELAVARRPPTTSTEAYQHYLMGRSFFLKGVWAKQALEIARELFAKAIDIDPNYARAYAGIANCDCYRLLLAVPNASFEVIAANSARALELEPGLAEAHASKGLALYTSGRYGDANEVFEEAVRLGPDLYEAYFFYARNCREQGLHAKAALLFERAAQLNSSDFRALGLVVDEYRALGRHEDSMDAARRCLDRLEMEISNQPDNACALAFGAIIQAEVGNQARAEDWANRAILIEPDDIISNYNLACTFAALGKFETALEWLPRAVPESPVSRRAFFSWMQHDTAMDPLRAHVGFQKLVESFAGGAGAGTPVSGVASAPSHRTRPGDRAAQPPTAAEDYPAIAVLPFENRSDEPDRLYFADGVVEQITAALARVRSFTVIARSSTARYRGQAIDPQVVGRQLGVRYLLEGSVGKSGDRIRITTQLLDASSGVHIWAERYDERIENIFDLQDRITESVVSAIAPTIRSAEIRRALRKRPQSLAAYDYVMRALPHVWALTSADCAEALRLTTEAIRLDPKYGLANALAAWCHAWQFGNDWTTAPDRTRSEGLGLAQAALKLDPDDPTVLTMVGATRVLLAHDLDMAAELIGKALRLDPNSAWAWIRSGYVHAYRGDAETALAHFERAQRLSPFDPFNFNLYVGFAFAHFIAGRYEQASEWAEKGLRERPDLPWAYRILAAAQPYLADADRCRWAAAKLREINPQISVSSVMAALPLKPDDARARFADGLRRAGLPEEAPAEPVQD